MKVLDLRCGLGHVFEGWFTSDDDYRSQGERGLLECPLCASSEVSRLPSAPHLNLSAPLDAQRAREAREIQEVRQEMAQTRPPPTPERQSVESMWLRAVKHVMTQTEDVGERFAEEARRIHYGESAVRGIRGRASGEEAEALRDEGIEVQALAVPESLKGTLQ